MIPKRLSLLALSLVVVLSCVVVASHISDQPNQQSKMLRMKVMRGNDHLKNKPTVQEIGSFKATQENERQFENSIPKHVPIKIKIRNEKEAAFKDLKNEGWARDFELELTNTGNKPIYEFYLLLVLPEIKTRGGLKVVFPLVFGRDELAETNVRATAEDVPIWPGETKAFKIDPRQVPVWEKLQREDHRPQPKKIQVKLEGLSFGDGTGYVGNEGTAIPRARSSLCPNGIEQNNKGGPAVLAAPLDVSRKSNHLSFAHATC